MGSNDRVGRIERYWLDLWDFISCLFYFLMYYLFFTCRILFLCLLSLLLFPSACISRQRPSTSSTVSKAVVNGTFFFRSRGIDLVCWVVLLKAKLINNIIIFIGIGMDPCDHEWRWGAAAAAGGCGRPQRRVHVWRPLQEATSGHAAPAARGR